MAPNKVFVPPEIQEIIDGKRKPANDYERTQADSLVKAGAKPSAGSPAANAQNKKPSNSKNPFTRGFGAAKAGAEAKGRNTINKYTPPSVGEGSSNAGTAENPWMTKDLVQERTLGRINPGVGKKLATASQSAIDRLVEASAKEKKADDFVDFAKFENFDDPRLSMESMWGELDSILGDSAAAKAAADPAALAAQKAALDKMLGLAEGGGWTAEEKARRLQQRADSDQWLRAQREADMSNLAERGMLGSGAELAALASDRQAAAGRNSLQDARAAADYERRALDAMMGAGELGGTMARDSFDRAFRTGDADDTFRSGKAGVLAGLKGSDIEYARGVVQDYRDKGYGWERSNVDKGVDVAGDREERAVEENKYAWDGVSDVATDDADRFTSSKEFWIDKNTEAEESRGKGATAGAEEEEARKRRGLERTGKGVFDIIDRVASSAS